MRMGCGTQQRVLSVTEWLTFRNKSSLRSLYTLLKALWKSFVHPLYDSFMFLPTNHSRDQVEHAESRSRFVLIHAFEVVLGFVWKGPLLPWPLSCPWRCVISYCRERERRRGENMSKRGFQRSTSELQVWTQKAKDCCLFLNRRPKKKERLESESLVRV